MKKLDIDLETTASADLAKCGIYKYVEAPDFAVTLFGYAADDADVTVIDLANGETIPDEIVATLTDDRVIKWAHNVSFERVCLSRFLGMPTGTYLSPVSWRCSMVWSTYLSLPQSLKEVGAVLKMDKQKLTEGKDLIRFFCTGQHTPSDDPERWARFKAYNKRDVETEMEIQRRLSRFPVPEAVWEEFILSEEINDRGVMVDMPFVQNAIRLEEQSRAESMDRLREITALDNPNSNAQMKAWLAEQGLPVEKLDKKTLAALLKTAPEELREALSLYRKLSKTSVKKYAAMENAVCSDGRVRGMFRFYGAAHTGRFSSKLIQLQNLAQNHLPNLETAKQCVRTGTYDEVKVAYPDIPDTLSQLVRTAFIPRSGTRFLVADFSAIEARVVAWLAGEQWVLDAFANGEDIYCATASRMFHVPVEKHGQNGELRQKGKQATLSCSYGGAAGALTAMGALDAGMTEEELPQLVQTWREANPNIVRLWNDLEKTAMRCVCKHRETQTHGVTFALESGILFMTLPSGRRLAYAKPRVGVNRFGSPSLAYEGTGVSRKWTRLETFGGKLTENLTQAVARDILCYALRNLADIGCEIVMHCHDEAIIEAPDTLSLQTVCDVMGRVPPWAEGLILRADGYECDFYRKD